MGLGIARWSCIIRYMNIEFYFDPVCPFCWVTSRWLLMVQPERGFRVEWKPFSLALKNGVLNNSKSTNKYAKSYRASHRILRIIIKASMESDVSLIDLYTAFGVRYHISNQEFNDELIKKVLGQFSLSNSLLKFADDKTIDNELNKFVDQAVEVVGEDIGVPTIVFNKGGNKSGYFGPVLQELPSKDEALKLWDGLVNLISVSSFYELKRSRPSDPPDVFSTAKC